VSISLFPSIGNWSFPCRSHYWIDGGRVIWADEWSDDMIANRARDRFAKQNHYAGQRSVASGAAAPPTPSRPGFWAGAASFVRSAASRAREALRKWG
jgi:uncharacterized protein DUF6527